MHQNVKNVTARQLNAILEGDMNVKYKSKEVFNGTFKRTPRTCTSLQGN